jgi:tetratricopeptide (TPR) repeat protein
MRLLLLALVLVSGLAQAQLPAAPSSMLLAQDSTPSLDTPANPEVPTEPPKGYSTQALTPRLMYEMLMAEVAAQRGVFDVALGLYADLGDETHDVRIYRRVVEMAVYTRQWNLVVGALDNWEQQDPGSLELQETRLVVGRLFRDTGNLNRAREQYQILLKSYPDSIELRYELAMIAEKQDRLDEMEQELRRVMELRPDYAQAWNALGYSLADRNLRLTEARGYIEQAVKLSPDDPYIQDSMGWIMFRQGEIATSLEVLKKAFAVSADAEIAAHLGEVEWAAGQQEEARKVWEAALYAHPDNELLQKTFKRFVH